ncbi:MAG: hypothetical protein IIV45_17330 [Lachnospiraceae bacterium]|nr:hypothetical protein [Lachnospiraceae bacterium]
MTTLEIFLVIAGVGLVVLSFILGERLEDTEIKEFRADATTLAEEIVKQQVDEAAKNVVDDTVEKTEAALDKLSNEKIMAVNDYSQTVLDEINKSHEEVMFLYSMLNDKEKDIKNTVRDIENVKKSVNNIQKNVSDNDIAAPVEEIEAADEEITEKVTDKTTDKKKTESVVAMKPKENNNNQKILDLYNEGKSNLEIAKELGLGIGEVRLVIDLFRSHSGKR